MDEKKRLRRHNNQSNRKTTKTPAKKHRPNPTRTSKNIHSQQKMWKRIQRMPNRNLRPTNAINRLKIDKKNVKNTDQTETMTLLLLNKAIQLYQRFTGKITTQSQLNRNWIFFYMRYKVNY